MVNMKFTLVILGIVLTLSCMSASTNIQSHPVIEIDEFDISGITLNLNKTLDLNITQNLTLGEKITFKFGEIIDNLVDGWIKITGSLNVEGDINISGNYKINDVTLNTSHISDQNTHTIEDTFENIINRGRTGTITIGLTGGLGVNWTAGEIYDSCDHLFITTDSGSGSLTDNQVNYLKYTGTSTLALSTTSSSSDDILIATFSVYDGTINGYRESSTMSESVSNARRAVRSLFPTRISSGMSVTEDVDVTNSLDVQMGSGEL